MRDNDIDFDYLDLESAGLSAPFSIEAFCGSARAGTLTTNHGPLQTPCFTSASNAAGLPELGPDELREVGVQALVVNTAGLSHHLGAAAIAAVSDLHRFLGWGGPIIGTVGSEQIFGLTDSGGVHGRLLGVTEDGVTFADHLDGTRRTMTPESSLAMLEAMGVDFAVPIYRAQLKPSRRTPDPELDRQWAERAMAARSRNDCLLLMGIPIHAIQGPALASFLTSLPGDGYAFAARPVTGLNARSEGPNGRFRHLSDDSGPLGFAQAVQGGFDCISSQAATRAARAGLAFTFAGPVSLADGVSLLDRQPIEPGCPCYTCLNFTWPYLQHLHTAQELLAPRLLAIHNLTFFVTLARRLRTAILEARLDSEVEEIARLYPTSGS